jgi:probable Rubsico expression protein CbbX
VTDAGSGSGRGFSIRSGSAPAPAEENGADGGKETTDFGDELLPDDAQVDVQSEEAAVHTKEVLDRLDRELVGLVPVKQRIREIGDLLLVDRLRRRFGIESTRPTLHMSFTGSPGTGKTTVALRMAELLHRLGYLRKGHLVSVTRDDLVGQYIGHTAPKTKEVLKRAMGGVLFIDEAYYLYRQENERDYGQETIEILLQIMENERENLVVILAGYKDRMDQFFQSNPGMGSRIAHHINFPDYSLDELLQIALLMLEEQRYEFSPDAEKAFRDYLERRMQQPRFANARSVRNALERSRLRQAARIVANPSQKLNKGDLMRIEAEDILQSRVFDADEATKTNSTGDDPSPEPSWET